VNRTLYRTANGLGFTRRDSLAGDQRFGRIDRIDQISP